jgi:hypothetical protein
LSDTDVRVQGIAIPSNFESAVRPENGSAENDQKSVASSIQLVSHTTAQLRLDNHQFDSEPYSNTVRRKRGRECFRPSLTNAFLAENDKLNCWPWENPAGNGHGSFDTDYSPYMSTTESLLSVEISNPENFSAEQRPHSEADNGSGAWKIKKFVPETGLRTLWQPVSPLNSCNDTQTSRNSSCSQIYESPLRYLDNQVAASNSLQSNDSTLSENEQYFAELCDLHSAHIRTFGDVSIAEILHHKYNDSQQQDFQAANGGTALSVD